MRLLKTNLGAFINSEAICRLSLEPTGTPDGVTGYYIAARLMDGETAFLPEHFTSYNEAEEGLNALVKMLTEE